MVLLCDEKPHVAYTCIFHAQLAREKLIPSFACCWNRLWPSGFTGPPVRIHRRRMRRANKCQKRPTSGAKETYYMRTFESLPGPPSWSDHFQSGPLITLAPPLKFCFVTAQQPTTLTSFFAASSDASSDASDGDADASADAESAARSSANAPGAKVTTSPTLMGMPLSSSGLGLSS